MQQRAVRCLVLMLYAAGVLGALWLATRFVLPFSAPFIFAYLIAALMERPVRFLVRHKVRRSPRTRRIGRHDRRIYHRQVGF